MELYLIMERKLASIRKVKEIKPIIGADNIELAFIDGWQCVIKKGELKQDDLCVYFEIDSLLPTCPVFSANCINLYSIILQSSPTQYFL